MDQWIVDIDTGSELLDDAGATASWSDQGVEAIRWAGREVASRASAARYAIAGTLVLWAPMVLWFLGNRPGFMTVDSFDVWRQATTGQWQDTHPIAYVLAMKVSEIVVHSPSLLTLGQSLYVAAGLALLARSLVRAGCHRIFTYAICGVVSWLPQVDGFVITLWKDIPYTAAMLCVAARVIDVMSFRLRNPAAVIPRRLLLSLFAHLLLTVILRQNGIFFAVFLGAMLLLVNSRRRRGVVVMTAALVVFFAFMKLALYPAMGVEKTPAEISISGFVHDINAAFHNDPEVFSYEDRQLMSKAMPLADWQTSYYCQAIIPWYLNPHMHLTEFREDSRKWLALWRKVALRRPQTVLENRICAASLAWRPAMTGSGYLYTLTYGVMDNPFGFKTEPVFQSVRHRTYVMLRWLDQPHRLWYTWRAPTWIYLADILLILQMLRFRRLVLLLPIAVLLAQQLNVTVLNPSQDARYMFGSFMVACAFLSVAGLTKEAFVSPALTDEITEESDVDSTSDGAASENGVGPHEVVVDRVDAHLRAGDRDG